jgi:FdhD protein
MLASVRRPVLRVSTDGELVRRPDPVAVEEPLEIRLDGRPFSVTMRTPGHDLDLALGFLVAEGVVRRWSDVVSATHCPDAGRDPAGRATHNVIEVRLAPSASRPDAFRAREVSSACGVCGSERLEAVRRQMGVDLRGDNVRLDTRDVAELPGRLRTAQKVFARTGGLHAAGLFRPDGHLDCLREDVGRHNAVDKVVGWALAAGRLPLTGCVVQVSGRASFELVQKAWAAGCPVLCAVSAPSSLAIDLAEEAGMTLVGFSRGSSFNVYAGAARLGLPAG